MVRALLLRPCLLALAAAAPPGAQATHDAAPEPLPIPVIGIGSRARNVLPARASRR